MLFLSLLTVRGRLFVLRSVIACRIAGSPAHLHVRPFSLPSAAGLAMPSRLPETASCPRRARFDALSRRRTGTLLSNLRTSPRQSTAGQTRELPLSPPPPTRRVALLELFRHPVRRSVGYELGRYLAANPPVGWRRESVGAAAPSPPSFPGESRTLRHVEEYTSRQSRAERLEWCVKWVVLQRRLTSHDGERPRWAMRR